MQSAFDDITIEAYLNKMAGFSLDDILGSGQSSVNSVLSTVNSNANLINKILSKMTVSVNETSCSTVRLLRDLKEILEKFHERCTGNDFR